MSDLCEKTQTCASHKVEVGFFLFFVFVFSFSLVLWHSPCKHPQV